MRAACLLLLVIVCGACGPAPTPVGFAVPIAVPSETAIDLRGAVRLDPTGVLQLTLDEPCRPRRASPYRSPMLHAEHQLPSAQLVVPVAPSSEDVDCDPARLAKIVVHAVTPSGYRVRGEWLDSRRVVFRVRWDEVGLDPLADQALTTASAAWAIGDVAWQPSRADAALILELVGAATDTEPAIVVGGAAPRLEVTTLEVADGALQAGGRGALTVAITNRGPGTAYRVIAQTRSSIASVHGLRASFGMIRPGVTKVRQLAVEVPDNENAPDTMLVVAVTEGNGYAPPNESRRIAIRPVEVAPVLALRCAIAGHPGASPEVEAGESVTVRCAVDNTGPIAAEVDLQVGVAGGAPVVSPVRPIASGAHGIFDLPVVIPRGLSLDAPVEVAVRARDQRYQRTATRTIAAIVRKPRLCIPGQLTRAQYRAKIAELRAAAAAGDLTQAELDRYDAELVGCLP